MEKMYTYTKMQLGIKKSYYKKKKIIRKFLILMNELFNMLVMILH